ncbi:MAG: acetate--CoA ligase family protein [Candidatus Methanodesulfokora sp.]
MRLDPIFKPEAVAVVGASRTEGKLGYTVLRNIKEGFKGRIYPVNPKADEILGLKCYSSIEEIPDRIDLAVILVPHSSVIDAIRSCAKKGARGFVVISGGFREAGREDLEKELVNEVRKVGGRLIGPNCQGINNPHMGLCASWPFIGKPGPIAIISQSGTIGAYMEMNCEFLGISKFVALGNKADVDEIDLLEYLADDQDTKVVSLYIEGTKNGRRFMDAVEKCSRRKPVVILKGGITEAGRESIKSHTGTLAGRDEVYDAAFRKAGAIRASNLEEFLDFTIALSFYGPRKIEEVVVITSSGGCGILASDAIETRGMRLMRLDGKVEKLREEMPDFVVLRNPLDLTGSAYAELYDKAMEIIGDADAYLLIFGDPIPGAFDVVRKHKEKNIFVSYLGGGDVEKEEVEKFRNAGFPVFPTPERAVNAMYAVRSYWRMLNKG